MIIIPLDPTQSVKRMAKGPRISLTILLFNNQFQGEKNCFRNVCIMRTDNNILPTELQITNLRLKGNDKICPPTSTDKRFDFHEGGDHSFFSFNEFKVQTRQP